MIRPDDAPENGDHPLLRRSTSLRTLDPDADGVEDLEALLGIVGDAQVVGIGEGAHFVREHGLARARLIRALVERGGFTHVAVELGRCQVANLQSWFAGDAGETELASVAGPLTLGLYGPLLRWLRGYNARAARPVILLGPDLPNTLQPAPDLRAAFRYFGAVDPEIAAGMAETTGIAAEIHGESAAVSALAWANVDERRRDRLTAQLARIALRMRALESRYVKRAGQAAYDTAWHHLDSARHTDQMLRAMHDLFQGQGLEADTSARERFMASSIEAFLAREGSRARVILVAHNNHIQKTPLSFDGELSALPCGHYLAQSLGESYRAVALTHAAAEVPEMSFPAPDSPVGFTVETVPLAVPAPGSVEHALADAGLAEAIALLNVRPDEPAIRALASIRSQSAAVQTSIHEAFDAVLSTPRASVEPELPF